MKLWTDNGQPPIRNAGMIESPELKIDIKHKIFTKDTVLHIPGLWDQHLLGMD